MAKRFIDTGIFRKPSIRAMKAPYKALFIYLLCECDHAGVWDVELDVAEARLGLKIDPEKALSEMGGAVVEVSPGKWHLVEFVEFQYGTLNPANRVHASVLSRLQSLGIDHEKKPLISPLIGAKDKEKDKDTQEGKERAKLDERFEALWSAYGKIGSKPQAFTYWRSLSEVDKMAVEAKLPAYVASTPGGQFRKHLQGWINPKGRLWESALVTAQEPVIENKPKGVWNML